MKKRTYILFALILCHTMLFCVSCKEEHSNKDREQYNIEYNMEELGYLEDLLTKEYDLEELKVFFEGRAANERIVFDIDSEPLLSSEVEQAYPIEAHRNIDRALCYSVYKVRQGGYYYVFWSRMMSAEGEMQDTLSAYFTSYIFKPKNQSLFVDIKADISTAADVKAIDPYMELDFLGSSGTHSYSLLDADHVLKITYGHTGEIEGPDDLIVKKMEIVSRYGPDGSHYFDILPEDLPSLFLD